jgi:hypothetical protein
LEFFATDIPGGRVACGERFQGGFFNNVQRFFLGAGTTVGIPFAAQGGLKLTF